MAAPQQARGTRVTAMRKIIAGNSWRKTRLHDQKGNLVPVRELRHVPRVCWQTLARFAFGALPIEPWWNFAAIERVSEIVNPGMDVLEFGAGQSTLWLAQRVRSVVSIESDPAWAERVRLQARRLDLTNIDLRLRNLDDYADCNDFPDGHFDFCVIDGAARGRCAETAFPKVRKGGWIYLDNSDNDMTFAPNGLNVRSAELALRKFVPVDRIEELTSFTTTQLGCHQGMLFHVP